MYKRLPLILFVLILLLGFFLRFWNLDSIPSGFHIDEVANAYLGRYVIENGKDIYDNVWPIFAIDKKGDFPPVLPMYVAGFSTKIFGNNMWATRAPFALFGVLIVVVTYFCAIKIFDRKKYLALSSMFVAAIMPWQVGFSRIGAEGVMAGLFFLIGLYFILKFLDKSRRYANLFIASFFGLFTYILYPSYRVTVPFSFFLIGIIQIVKSKNNLKDRKAYVLLIVSILFFVISFAVSRTDWGASRFAQTSWVGAYQNGQNPWQKYSMQDGNILTARIFNSKLIFFATSFISEYFRYFSPDFLFLSEAKPVWFAIPRIGLLDLSLFVFLIISLLVLIRDSKNKVVQERMILLFGLLVVAPFGSALTSEHTPNAHRSMQMAYLLPFVVPYFLLFINENYKKYFHYFMVLFVSLLLLETIWFSYNMFVEWSMNSAVYRDDGLFQAAQVAAKSSNKYNRIFMFNSGWYSLYYLFASNNYSSKLIGQFAPEFQIKNIDNVYFYRMECPQDTWQISHQSKGKEALFVQKDCKLDKMKPAPKFVENIKGSDPRFENMALYELQ
ncbi:MAG: glycosyltransferase family 39 protein [Patescibacteria group bacterium]